MLAGIGGVAMIAALSGPARSGDIAADAAVNSFNGSAISEVTLSQTLTGPLFLDSGGSFSPGNLTTGDISDNVSGPSTGVSVTAYNTGIANQGAPIAISVVMPAAAPAEGANAGASATLGQSLGFGAGIAQ
ncbi:MAG: hypothetical protein WEB85_13730 [Dongiaceae bacterium]